MAAREDVCLIQGSQKDQQKLEDSCPDIIYAQVSNKLKTIFKHDNFKSKLQEEAVKKVALSKLCRLVYIILLNILFQFIYLFLHNLNTMLHMFLKNTYKKTGLSSHIKNRFDLRRSPCKVQSNTFLGYIRVKSQFTVIDTVK